MIHVWPTGVVLILLALCTGALFGDIHRAWRIGWGPFERTVKSDPEQLQRMGRAARLPRGEQRSAMRVVR